MAQQPAVDGNEDEDKVVNNDYEGAMVEMTMVVLGTVMMLMLLVMLLMETDDDLACPLCCASAPHS